MAGAPADASTTVQLPTPTANSPAAAPAPPSLAAASPSTQQDDKEPLLGQGFQDSAAPSSLKAVAGDPLSNIPPVLDRPRDFALWFVTWPPFDYFILLVIIASCVVMARQSPVDKLNGLQDAFHRQLEWSFTGIFTIEVAIKMFALGPSGYFGEVCTDPPARSATAPCRLLARRSERCTHALLPQCHNRLV